MPIKDAPQGGNDGERRLAGTSRKRLNKHSAHPDASLHGFRRCPQPAIKRAIAQMWKKLSGEDGNAGFSGAPKLVVPLGRLSNVGGFKYVAPF